MMRKTIYVCDGCGKEYRDGKPRLKLFMNRCDARLDIVADDELEVAIPEDGDLHFCDLDCLKFYFARLVGVDPVSDGGDAE